MEKTEKAYKKAKYRVNEDGRLLYVEMLEKLQMKDKVHHSWTCAELDALALAWMYGADLSHNFLQCMIETGARDFCHLGHFQFPRALTSAMAEKARKELQEVAEMGDRVWSNEIELREKAAFLFYDPSWKRRYSRE
jgi:hypothetical protein